MRILVLGASGYVGGRLLEKLRTSEWAVPVAAVRPQTADKFRKSDFENWKAFTKKLKDFNSSMILIKKP